MITEKLHKNFGICITSNIDYDDPKIASEITQLVGEERIVCIKNTAPVLPKDLVTLYKNMGRVAAQSKKIEDCLVEGFPELIKVKKDGFFKGQDDGELFWHNAILNKSDAEDIVAMYMHNTSTSGGDTYFTDAQSAYDDLDDATKKDIDQMMCVAVPMTNIDERNPRILKLLAKSYQGQIYPTQEAAYEWVDVDGIKTHTKVLDEKPLVITHPINGKKGLHFPWTVFRTMAGKSKSESKEIFLFLKDHLLQEKYVYRHNWSKYDICLSDQVHSLHKRDAFIGSRELWRSGIWI